MFPNQPMHTDVRNPYMLYNMYPFEPYHGTQPNYFQPFQLSFMNGMSQPTFYPPQSPMMPQMNPYTMYPATNKQNYKKQSQGQTAGLMSQFKTADGNYDINKMMNTAGQMMNAMNQVTGIVKQVGGFFGR